MNKDRRITIALAGNPNCGKTTLFNNLTGARQHVGNYPGVTVEKKEGLCPFDGVQIAVVDLPGTYNLSSHSAEEVVAREFILRDKPDVVVHVVDASNIERHLYLGVQFMELGVPLVYALNMSDVAQARGLKFDLAKLSVFLGGPVVPTVGNRGEGTTALLQAVLDVSREPDRFPPPRLSYGREIDAALTRIAALLETTASLPAGLKSRWTALKLLEGDTWVAEQVRCLEVRDAVRQAATQLQGLFGEPPGTLIPGRRYGFISGACQESVQSTVELQHCWSDRIDTVVLSPLLGLPLFLALMYVVFQLTFAIGNAPVQWLENAFGWLAAGIAGAWPGGTDSPLCSLIVDGIIGGVGGVLAFVPNIMLLFLAIAVLEDSGYMARAAFIMDGIMHRIGLHGKSFIPMVIGFGCSVPAILATRTLDTRRDRLTTMMVAPLMSCGARLPIYSLFIPAFFPPRWQGPVLWLIYLTGIVLAVVAARVLRSTILRGRTTPLVMELPPYHVPTLKGCGLHTWERTWLYLRKAGTMILGFSVVLWAMTAYPKKTVFERDYDAEAGAARTQRDARVLDLAARTGLQINPDAIEARWPAAGARAGTVAATGDAFADACTAIETARRHFTPVAESTDGRELATQVVYFVQHRDAELRHLREHNPQVHDAALEYIDRIREPYRRECRELAAARQAELLAYSVSGRIGRALEPVLAPLGFDWRINAALLGALAGKELVVAQLGIVFAVEQEAGGGDGLRCRLQEAYSPLTGLCVMLFCLISAPCVATLATTKQEAGGWRWALLQTGGLTAMAYVVTLIVFQTGRLLGLGG
ncbi:MAG: ferrous iron transport protein B [Lentisphaerae bacterium RIFOXYB12_FULL_65_16]|nr:MAG: ferrous iron transport protein B [Lentisphaerae bacterium RIFOXYA12_64_32]OGV91296.1 MAG: ferrous iron transport protein B [Lentisphaerae bacterium RIFOXYB12_FULL_65_16]